MDHVQPRSNKIKRMIIAFTAWITVLVFGIITLLFCSLLSGAILGSALDEAVASKYAIIIGAFGIMLLLMVLSLTWHLRGKIFAKHFLTGLFIGVGLYGLIFIGGAVGFIATNVAMSDEASVSCTNLSSQFSRAQSAVVPIATEAGTGTGFAVRDGNTILTAYHVIEGATDIKVNFLNDERPMTIIAVAPEFDLALLRLEKPVGEYMNLSQSYSVSESLYAYGYPGNAFDAGQASLSSGVLSRVLTNEDLKLNSPDAPVGLEIVQTDMALNPGNSGGPIFNKCGVVGVVSMKSNTQEFAGISSEEGINYGISSRTTAQRFVLPINNQ